MLLQRQRFTYQLRNIFHQKRQNINIIFLPRITLLMRNFQKHDITNNLTAVSLEQLTFLRHFKEI